MCSFSFMEQKEGGSAKVTTKVFTFEDKNTKESLTVSIPEVLDPQYGMYVWPCAVVMAQYLWTHRDDLTGRTVLELGAGVSLPGVLAALCGAQVILTDSLDKPLCLENCKRSCDTNGLQNITVLGLSWGEVSPDLLLLPKLDIILGSDVFYDPVDFEDILVTFVCLLRKNPKAQFWTTYQVRCADWSIEVLLRRWNLNCVEVPLSQFDADEFELAGSNLPGSHSIQMLIITQKEESDGATGGLERSINPSTSD
ncbi:histone-arginine methyltransferase METTL23 [Nothobranchius furzeri]|uniref:Methyltransferase 23, arginine n=1 Tax=Nothobranchius furzeri TaxID=105023 RepID=A0A1A8BAP3_NOTFU|nr:histone-arginine methyltransferase METTL23 [Nothobranchius furzeri]KAF7227484.1 methyltransferase like 23 [Nothobranchius furzeri]